MAPIWMVALAALLSCAPCCMADVIVIDCKLNKTVNIMADMPSLFGPQLSMLGIKGLLHMADPPSGCGPISPPPQLPPDTVPAYMRWVALIKRRNCSFADKVIRAQAAGYSAVIVMNIGSDNIEPMSAAPGDADNITIPSVFIGQSDGDTLQIFMQTNDYARFGLIITGELPFNIQSYLLPFAITVAVCFLGMLICMVVKCVRDYRRSLRHRLSWRALRRLPLHKFQAGVDSYEVCAICLDDYAEGDKLRILPCNHAYHSRCIDPWLTKRRRVCPVCKQKVRVGGETAADDTSDTDDETERSTSERAPLLQQATQVSAGTFAANRENPFQRAGRRNRDGYSRMDHDRINNASLVDEDANNADDDYSSSSAGGGGATGGGRGAGAGDQAAAEGAGGGAGSVSMAPTADEGAVGELDVVSITRSVKKKSKKRKTRKRSEGEEGSKSSRRGGDVGSSDDSGGAAAGRRKGGGDCVVQVESVEQDAASAAVDGDYSSTAAGSDPIV